METLALLFRRARDTASREDYMIWAETLLGEGRSEAAIVRLAIDADIEPNERNRYLAEILPSLGYRMPADLLDLLRILEAKKLEQYANGALSGIELVMQCSELWRLSEYDDEFRIWHDLDEDIRLTEEGYGPIFYDIKKDDMEAGILNALTPKLNEN